MLTNLIITRIKQLIQYIDNTKFKYLRYSSNYSSRSIVININRIIMASLFVMLGTIAHFTKASGKYTFITKALNKVVKMVKI